MHSFGPEVWPDDERQLLYLVIDMFLLLGFLGFYELRHKELGRTGALGFSTDLPLEHMYRSARAARIYDGPDEVHKVTVARKLLKDYKPVDVPSEHVPTNRALAKEKFADLLMSLSANAND